MRRTDERKLWWLVMATMLFALHSAHADLVTEWNVTAMEVSAQTNSLVQSRALAITHAAVFDAVNAIGGKYKVYVAEVKAPAGASQEAAAAAAAHAVLSWLLPAQKGVLDGALTKSLANVPEGTAKDDGVTVGKQVAERYIAMRSDDGSAGKLDTRRRVAPGNGSPHRLHRRRCSCRTGPRSPPSC